MLIVLASCNTNPNQSSNQQAQGVATADNIYNIDNTQSQITWTGREVSTSSHYGTLDFVSGTFEISNGSIVNGQFIVDMTSINNQDMEGDSKARFADQPSSELIISKLTGCVNPLIDKSAKTFHFPSDINSELLIDIAAVG
jgi:hypothetical protein